MTDNRIKAAIFLIIGLIGAVYLGIGSATAQVETIIKVAGTLLLITCALLGRKIWLLLIFFMALNIPIIRGFGTVEVGQCLFLGFTFLITLMRRQPYNFKFGELEFWMLLLVGCIAQVYLRNPVGLNILGAGAVGARPYFMVAMAFSTGVVLGNIVVKPEEIKWAMKLSIVGTFLGFGLNALRPSGTGAAGGVSVSSNQTLGDEQQSGRVVEIISLGDSIARVVVAYISPIQALLKPLWLFLILISLAAAAASGYRNAIAAMGFFYLLGLAYRGGFISVLIASMAGVLGLAVLAIWNAAMPLPPNIQRALSPFPGTWEERHVKGAQESTEWRVEMWKEALFTDFWIQNKLLGDGLGFTRRELRMMQDLQHGGSYATVGSGMTAQQETMMVTGNYHSGPVQTVRAVGYLGLIILVISMVRLAVRAHRLILRCRNTEWFPVALFFGIPAIVLPPFFVFIVGDFGTDVAKVFFFYGILNILEKNLPLAALDDTPYIPLALRH